MGRGTLNIYYYIEKIAANDVTQLSIHKDEQNKRMSVFQLDSIVSILDIEEHQTKSQFFTFHNVELAGENSIDPPQQQQPAHFHRVHNAKVDTIIIINITWWWYIRYIWPSASILENIKERMNDVYNKI